MALAAGAVLVITAVRVRSDMNAATDVADQALTTFQDGNKNLARSLLNNTLTKIQSTNNTTNPF